MLLYIPVPEFVCWLKWLGSRKALAGMQVPFLLGAFGKFCLRVLRKMGWEGSLAIPYPRKAKTTTGWKRTHKGTAKCPSAAKLLEGSLGNSFRSAVLEQVMEETHPGCHVPGTAADKNEYLVIFPENSWKFCALGQFIPEITEAEA